ncbi:hypothetical protein A6P53_10610 [Enterococcus hirae]|nr:hypothetical protein A6P53_10610 [Enterococcus hirae]MBO1132899.1 hypothetical protein [Enterococcus hirae]
MKKIFDHKGLCLAMILSISCWIIGGVNLFLSTKIESKFLKRIIIFLNLICILGWLFFGG